MFKMSMNEIIDKIKEKSKLSEEEISKKITEKCESLAGLVSKEGAAHIVANELGIKLFEQVSGRIQIKNILVGMRNVETVGVVQQVYEMRTFRRQNREGEEYEGKVASFFIADETGRIRVTLWNDQTDNLKEISVGRTVMLKDAMVKENMGGKELHMNSKSSVILDPLGVEIKNPVESTSVPGAVRRRIMDLKDGDSDVEIFAYIVSCFEPRFFEVCPNCAKRVRLREDQYHCDEHKEVQPDYSYVFNATLDDGTETIRTVFFRAQMERLLDMTKEQILEMRGQQEKLAELSRGLIGLCARVAGRVVKNAMFDRTEFIARNVIRDPDPKEELSRLGAEDQSAADSGEKTQKQEKETEEPAGAGSPDSASASEATPAKTEVFGSGDSESQIDTSDDTGAPDDTIF